MDNIKEKLLSKKTGKAEIIALLIYIAGLIFIACFHEPWFDEAEAWQIARCASIKKILFEIPHYEGHPQLWHLLLAVFAKSGAPYELSLKGINIAIISGAMAVLLFKSPFPKIIRCLLPFNYFFFYQYGVISRPYSILLLAIFLTAAGYRERNTHPWKYILPLCLLCLSSAYGIIIAGGLCLVWTFEIISELAKEKKFNTVFKDMRVYSLVTILILALFLAVCIFPAEDCYSPNKEYSYVGETHILAPGLIVLSLLPFDSWSGIMYGPETLDTFVRGVLFDIVIGLVLWVLLIGIAVKNKKTLTFLIPYLALSCFMAFGYVFTQHIGISTGFLVFFLWIVCDTETGLVLPEAIHKISKSISTPFVRKVLYCGLTVVGAAPFLYSAVSSFNEIRYSYSEAPFADVIKENGLENTKIMTFWQVHEGSSHSDSLASNRTMFNFLEQPSEHNEVLLNLTYDNWVAADLLPYFDDNIFMNFNVDCPGENYVHHKFTKDVDAVFRSWADKGLPDFLLGYCYLDEIYDEKTLEGVRYLPIVSKSKFVVYKLEAKETKTIFYIREDLLDQYPQFHWIYDPENPTYEY